MKFKSLVGVISRNLYINSNFFILTYADNRREIHGKLPLKVERAHAGGNCDSRLSPPS